MRIAFICGCLEPGRDGVGDYTRILSANLISQGHEVIIIALYDVLLNTLKSTQEIEDISVNTLRIPESVGDSKRINIIKQCLQDFKPEVLSLQFVVFSFHRKGLPWNLLKIFHSIDKPPIFHIMFHELWVGMPKHSTTAHVIWGWLQCNLIKIIIKSVKPDFIHTHTWLYQAQLARIGIPAAILPLFSNIQINIRNNKSIKKAFFAPEKQKISLVIFGTIHAYSSIELLLEEVLSFAHKNGTGVCLQAIGRCGPELERWTLLWQSAGLEINLLGEQSSERISEVLSESSIGITTTALPMIQKSGSVAAMRQHGLPVICVSAPWEPRGLESPEPPAGIFSLRKGVIEDCLAYEEHESTSYLNSFDVSHLFIKSLQKSEQ